MADHGIYIIFSISESGDLYFYKTQVLQVYRWPITSYLLYAKLHRHMKQITSQKAKKLEATNKTKHWAPPLFRQQSWLHSKP